MRSVQETKLFILKQEAVNAIQQATESLQKLRMEISEWYKNKSPNRFLDHGSDMLIIVVFLVYLIIPLGKVSVLSSRYQYLSLATTSYNVMPCIFD